MNATIGNWKNQAKVNMHCKNQSTGLWAPKPSIEWFLLHQGSREGDFLLFHDKDEAIKEFHESKRFKNILGGVRAPNYMSIKLSRSLIVVCRESFLDRPVDLDNFEDEQGCVSIYDNPNVYEYLWPFEDLFTVSLVLSEDCSRWERRFQWV